MWSTVATAKFTVTLSMLRTRSYRSGFSQSTPKANLTNAPRSSSLRLIARAAASRLSPWFINVRTHVSGDAVTRTCRAQGKSRKRM